MPFAVHFFCFNRCWGPLNQATATAAAAEGPPETAAAMAALRAMGGPDVLLDVHQDEHQPWVQTLT